jgi:hypothetical protein
VECRGLGSAAPEIIVGDPVAAGYLDRRSRRRALLFGTMVGPGIRSRPSPRLVPAPPDLGGRLQPVGEPGRSAPKRAGDVESTGRSDAEVTAIPAVRGTG